MTPRMTPRMTLSATRPSPPFQRSHPIQPTFIQVECSFISFTYWYSGFMRNATSRSEPAMLFWRAWQSFSVQPVLVSSQRCI